MPNDFRLIDVCVVIQDLFKKIAENGDVVTPPIHVKRDIIPAIAAIHSTSAQYKIILQCKKWDHRYLSGWLRRYNDHAKIIYSAEDNTCWKRFVVCKELAHLLIDTDAEHYTKDPVALAQELINDVPVLRADSDIGSERFATMAAIEMLLPWCLRGRMRAMANEGLTDLKIAQEFRAPEKFVNLILRSKYGQTSDEANSFKEAAPIKT